MRSNSAACVYYAAGRSSGSCRGWQFGALEGPRQCLIHCKLKATWSWQPCRSQQATHMTRNLQKKKEPTNTQKEGLQQQRGRQLKGSAGRSNEQWCWSSRNWCSSSLLLVKTERAGVVSEGEKLLKLRQIQCAKEWFERLKNLGRLGAAGTVAEEEGLQIQLWSSGYIRAW